MGVSTTILIIVALVSSIVGAILAIVISSIFKKWHWDEITIKFKDRKIKTVPLPRGFSEEETDRLIRKALDEERVLSQWQLFIRYIFDMAVGITIFLVLLVASQITHWLNKAFNIPSLAKVLNMVELLLFSLGAVLCLVFVARNTFDFLIVLLSDVRLKLSEKREGKKGGSK